MIAFGFAPTARAREDGVITSPSRLLSSTRTRFMFVDIECSERGMCARVVSRDVTHGLRTVLQRYDAGEGSVSHY